MPLRWALRWFSEVCGLLLGVGLVWCMSEIRRCHERIDGLQKSHVIQENNQTVIVESDRVKSILERVKQLGPSDVIRNDLPRLPNVNINEPAAGSAAASAANPNAAAGAK